MLERGAVYVDSGVGPGRHPGSVGIHTPLGVVRDIGTQYEVRVDDAFPPVFLAVLEDALIAVQVPGDGMIQFNGNRDSL